MKKRIWKFQLEITHRNVITMPVGARVLRVDIQHGVPTIWALVDPKAETEKREFCFVATGMDFQPEGLDYLGTLQVDAGRFVFHVWEPHR